MSEEELKDQELRTCSWPSFEKTHTRGYECYDCSYFSVKSVVIENKELRSCRWPSCKEMQTPGGHQCIRLLWISSPGASSARVQLAVCEQALAGAKDVLNINTDEDTGG